MDPRSPWRYGVFLRPSPQLMRLSLQAFDIVTRQFGARAAASFPPHVTLMGNFAIDVRERDLVSALDSLLDSRQAIPMHSSGLQIHGHDSIGINMHLDADGEPNAALISLVTDLFEAITPLRVFPSTDRRMESRRHEGAHTFAAHLTLLGHDGVDFPGLAPEVVSVLRELDLEPFGAWPGDTVHLLRFHSEDWSGRYWETMQWCHLKSWKLDA